MQKRKTTKELLMDSFMELAAQKPISKITIHNITDNCGLSQPTFYHHFKDKYDLICQVYMANAAKIMGKIGIAGYTWQDSVYDGLQYFSSNRNFILNALKHTSGRDAFLNQLQQANFYFLSNELQRTLKTEEIPENLLTMAQVYCYGTVQMICTWLSHDMSMPPAQLAEILVQCLPSPLHPYLYPDVNP